jgi:hypothetical protein
MRDAVIDGQLQHLRIDHDQPALLRRQPVEQRQDHGVDGDRLARAGGAGDQQMRHAARSTMTGSPPMVLPSAERQLGLRVVVVAARQQLAQVDLSRLALGSSMPMALRPGHHGDAGGDRAHRAGDVVGEPDDARGLDAGRRLELVERDHRAGARR